MARGVDGCIAVLGGFADGRAGDCIVRRSRAGYDVLLVERPASRTWCVPRVSRAELVYAVTCVGLFVVAALDGGDQVWPYITLTVALLPAGLFSLALLPAECCRPVPPLAGA